MTDIEKKIEKAVKELDYVCNKGLLTSKEKDFLLSALILLTKLQVELLRRGIKEAKGTSVMVPEEV